MADIGGVVTADSPQTAIECDLCLEILANPYSLTCGHTFCYQCMTASISANSELNIKARCPQCRNDINILPHIPWKVQKPHRFSQIVLISLQWFRQTIASIVAQMPDNEPKQTYSMRQAEAERNIADGVTIEVVYEANAPRVAVVIGEGGAKDNGDGDNREEHDDDEDDD